MAIKPIQRFEEKKYSELTHQQQKQFLELSEKAAVGSYVLRKSLETPRFSLLANCIVDNLHGGKIIATRTSYIGGFPPTLNLFSSSQDFSKSSADFFKLTGITPNGQLFGQCLKWGKLRGCRRIKMQLTTADSEKSVERLEKEGILQKTQNSEIWQIKKWPKPANLRKIQTPKKTPKPKSQGASLLEKLKEQLKKRTRLK